ncbi:MAG: hypothetical protein FWG15_03640 [Propionibacteriaceae bacterium]|nr:hypothetical protein [Propionibacteriaceae bacterium]
MEYNATAILGCDFQQMTEEETDALLDRYTGNCPAIGSGITGATELVITIDSDSLDRATQKARSMFIGLELVGMEVIETVVWDLRTSILESSKELLLA